MIYTRFGSSVTIVRNCGEHKPPYFRYPAHLVKVRFDDDQSEKFYWADFLKADNGWGEIQDAMKTAYYLLLDGNQEKLAYEEAE